VASASRAEAEAAPALAMGELKLDPDSAMEELDPVTAMEEVDPSLGHWGA